MKLKTTLMATGATLIAAAALAQSNMADSMTVVSWGGAYQNSQVKAYIEPYVANNPGLNVITDESSAEA
ncbi:MAG: ABC transporter substrate-binding protein, partial [Rhodobacterales bacterium]|nr:ABC transporter substrate-binding protein [Rhodobacterales bacterium]MDX5411729.1 ABC transporter substrate-binding protein [Rhodobacterales bacterium]